MTLLDQVHVSSRSKVLPTPPRHTPWYQDALWVLPSSPLALLYLRFQSTRPAYIRVNRNPARRLPSISDNPPLQKILPKWEITLPLFLHQGVRPSVRSISTIHLNKGLRLCPSSMSRPHPHPAHVAGVNQIPVASHSQSSLVKRPTGASSEPTSFDNSVLDQYLGATAGSRGGRPPLPHCSGRVLWAQPWVHLTGLLPLSSISDLGRRD